MTQEEAFIQAFNDLAKTIHQDNVAKGFWPEGGRVDTESGFSPGTRNVGESLMLTVTELSEGYEAWRKDKKDDHLPHRDGLTVEIADAMIRLMDLSYGLGLPVAAALIEKLVYNRQRPHMHGKKC